MEEDLQKDNELEMTEDVSEDKEESLPVTEPKKPSLEVEMEELKDKYLRLYADFENYRKRVNKDKEELVKYANESLIYELFPSIDHLKIALQHCSNETSSGIVQGVEITLRELERTLEKFGLKPIEALGKPFNPGFHHAMSQVEREDVDEMTIIEEFRTGYIYGDKVLRASLVSVSRKPQKPEDVNIKEEDINDNDYENNEI